MGNAGSRCCDTRGQVGVDSSDNFKYLLLADDLGNDEVVIYNLGNNRLTIKEEDAKALLLESYFPDIYELRNVQKEEDFESGAIGPKFIPEISPSEIPRAVGTGVARVARATPRIGDL